MNTPVLFLVFNRPDSTRQVFEAIRQARPPRLYVAADGPRENREGERERCEEVRKISTAVDWPCVIRTQFRSENLGCKYAVSSAITWFFNMEEEGIILEDDILPGRDFFSFCEAQLDHYRDKSQVMMIAGCNPVAGKYETQNTYDFTNFALVWGWASWRRAWNYYDVEMQEWPRCRKNRCLSKIPNVSKEFEIIWTEIYDKTYSNQIDTWDFQWFFAINSNHASIIIPKYNLINNLGFNEEATHSNQGMPDYVKNLTIGQLPEVYIRPNLIINNQQIDHLFEKILFGVNRYTYSKYLIKKILGPRLVNKISKIKCKQ